MTSSKPWGRLKYGAVTHMLDAPTTLISTHVEFM